jgi:hypothetical protein
MNPACLRERRAGAVRGVCLLALVTAAAHGMCLWEGKVLDDFWHQRGLREHGWGFSEIMRTLNISPADFLHTWWQERDVCWHYLRPFFIVCMKVVFLLIGGGDPMALHAFSLGLHFLSAVMVWRLARRLTGEDVWSLIAGTLFVIYPHAVITVAWPSSQNVVLQTTLLLAAMLAYFRASGLRPGPEETAGSRERAGQEPPPIERRPLAAATGLWLLALLTRENAVLFPLWLAACELAWGGGRRLWARRRLYAVAGLVAVAFMLWREWMAIAPLPDVYCRRPAGDWAEYGPWLAAKFLHYLCASVWPSPMTVGPTGRYAPWAEAPGDCALMLVIVGLLGGLYLASARGARGGWLWPLWIVLSVLPVTAVVATPHSGYMSGVGLAMCAAVGPAAARARWQPGGLARQRWIGTVAAATCAVLLCASAFMTAVNRLQWKGIAAAERFVPSWIMVSPPPREARDVFFINLPFVNIYLKPNLVDRLGPSFEEVRVHMLTCAPYPLMMDRRTVVEQLDERSFSVSVEGQAWFSRLLGRFLLEAFRGPGRFAAGERITGRDFDVDVVEADEEGVRKLRFTFPRPLSDPRYCFYLTTQACGAARLRWATGDADPMGRAPVPKPPADLAVAAAMLEGGHAEAAGPLFDARAEGPLRPMLRYLTAALGSPLQAALDGETLAAEDWERLRRWWESCVDDRCLSETWLRRNDFDDLAWLRSEIEWDRYVASFVFRTDLYLTGPPFPGPRAAGTAGDQPSSRATRASTSAESSEPTGAERSAQGA